MVNQKEVNNILIFPGCEIILKTIMDKLLFEGETLKITKHIDGGSIVRFETPKNIEGIFSGPETCRMILLS